MSAADFTQEEMQMVAIYHGKNKDVTMASMTNVSRYIKDKDLQHIMYDAIKKLNKMTDQEFDVVSFACEY